MDFIGVAYMGFGIFGVILGCFGWSHANLSKRLDKLSIDMQERKTDADIRVLISDKIEPYKIQLQGLGKQLDMIAHQYSELDKKLDSLISTVQKSFHVV